MPYSLDFALTVIAGLLFLAAALGLPTRITRVPSADRVDDVLHRVRLLAAGLALLTITLLTPPGW